MRIADVFHSIQGEGKLTGVPSVFVRASGCNLRCKWCDTPYASWNPQGDEQSVDSIIDTVRNYNCHHVVLTGGEPMIMAEITELSERLHAGDMHVTVETAATVYRPVSVHLASLSPKLSNSTPQLLEKGRFAQLHEKSRLNFETIQKFIDTAPMIQLKFVVASESDLGEIKQILSRVRGWEEPDVLLMPEGTDVNTLNERGEWLAEICKRTGYRFCPRLHIQLYGNKRGT